MWIWKHRKLKINNMENIINVLIEKTKNGYSAFSNEVAGVTYD